MEMTNSPTTSPAHSPPGSPPGSPRLQLRGAPKPPKQKHPGPEGLHILHEHNGHHHHDDHDDDFALFDLPENSVPWAEKGRRARLLTALTNVGRVVALMPLLYMYICALHFFATALRLFAGMGTGEVFSKQEFHVNAPASVMTGLLGTVMLQSSGTTVMVIISMVDAGHLSVYHAVFMIMGANIGTTYTNNIVACGTFPKPLELRRAFAGAVVHDLFNMLTVAVLFPIEWFTGALGSWQGCGLLCQIAGSMAGGVAPVSAPTRGHTSLMNTIISPFIGLVIRLDPDVVYGVDHGNFSAYVQTNYSLVRHWCPAEETVPVLGLSNETGQCAVLGHEVRTVQQACPFMMEYISHYWPDWGVGIVVLVISLLFLNVALLTAGVFLGPMLMGKKSFEIRTMINGPLPALGQHLTGYIVIMVGVGATIILQGSSVTTCILIPLFATTIISIERGYEVSLGANIGTAFCILLTVVSTQAADMHVTLQLALVHVLFNLIGVIIWYPVPVMRRVPLRMAKALGLVAADHRWFLLIYMLVPMGVLPGIVLGLATAGIPVFVPVMLVVLALVVAVFVVRHLQATRPSALPAVLRDWSFLPKPLHSLEPYDRIFATVCGCCPAYKKPPTHVAVEESAAPPPDVTAGEHGAMYTIPGHVNPAWEPDDQQHSTVDRRQHHAGEPQSQIICEQPDPVMTLAGPDTTVFIRRNNSRTTDTHI